jgi:DNA-binding transcriptional LysR family regulator
MELEHLRTFLAVYRTGNLTKAAEVLHVSQPAVSQHIKALEAELARPLFLRFARGVTPTPLADSLAREVTAPLDTLSVAAATFRSGSDTFSATLYLAGPSDALAEKVVPALVSLTNAGLHVRAQTGLTKDLISRLGEGELDMVIATAPTRHRNVTVERLFDETLVLVASPAVAGKVDRGRLNRSDPTALSHLPMVAYAENLPLIRRYWRSVFPGAQTGTARIVLDDLRGVIRTVTNDGGISVIPSYLARGPLASGALVQLLHQAQPPTNTLYLATRTSRPQPHVIAVAHHLKQLATTW